MKKTTKIIIASLLTFGIVGGAAAFGVNKFSDDGKRGDRVVSYIVSELSLDQTQQDALTALKDQMQEARSNLKDEMSGSKEAFHALLLADRFDQSQALEMINNKTLSINEMAPEMLAGLGAFLDTLSAEQKAELAELIDRKGRRNGRGNSDLI